MFTVKKAFDAAAQTYDRSRRQLIPCFDDFYATALDLISYKPEDSFRILDLGAGTGLLSLFILEKFSNAEVTLLDLSEAMLAKAKERFAGRRDSVEFVVANYAEGVRGEFDCIVSALSIHHLPDERKQGLFRNIYSALPKGGLFINADQVLGVSPEIEKIYREAWIRQIHRLGVSEEDFRGAQERMKEDKMASLESQMQWLKEAGFVAVNCWYKNYSFAVFSGRKGD